MGSEWREFRFEELLEIPLRNGIYKKKEFHGRGSRIVNMGELFAYPRLFDVTMKRVELDEKDRQNALLEEGDLLFARRSLTAEGAGKCSIVKKVSEETTFESSLIRARPNKNTALPDYLYYFFDSPQGRHLIGTILRQVAVSGITGTDLKQLKIPLPSLPRQRSVSDILASLDDKIALNHQINTTLESMAQALFKSWFVDFDPVIDNALAAGNPIPEALQARADPRAALGDQRKPLPDRIRQQFPDRFVLTEEMGWVPEGWHISTIGEEVETTGGGTPSTKNPDFWESGTHPFCTPKDMSQLKSLVLMDTERHLTDAGVRKISSGQLPKGTVLMSSRAPIGYLAISDIPVSVNQGIIAMLPNQHYGPVYLLCWAKTNMNHITDRANGSTFQEISKKNFRPIPFLVPGKGILEAFNEQAEAIYSRILLTSEQTDALTRLRDTLLPKLLSGELRVPEAERPVAEII